MARWPLRDSIVGCATTSCVGCFIKSILQVPRPRIFRGFPEWELFFWFFFLSAIRAPFIGNRQKVFCGGRGSKESGNDHYRGLPSPEPLCREQPEGGRDEVQQAAARHRPGDTPTHPLKPPPSLGPSPVFACRVQASLCLKPSHPACVLRLKRRWVSMAGV